MGKRDKNIFPVCDNREDKNVANCFCSCVAQQANLSDQYNSVGHMAR